MIDTPLLVQTELQHTAVVRIVIPRAQMRFVMGPAIAEVFAALTSRHVAPIGPLFSHHLRMDPETFDFEVGVPVAQPFEPTGRVIASTLPATTVARTVYRGAYEWLGGAWGEFSQWLEANGHAPAADLWECYLAGPESSPDPTKWATELNRPLLAR